MAITVVGSHFPFALIIIVSPTANGIKGAAVVLIFLLFI